MKIQDWCCQGLIASSASQLRIVEVDTDAARTPDAEFTVGDMFALPLPDRRFDVITRFNGIWSDCEAALVEARRVLRPGGRFGMTIWGAPKRLGLMPYFATVTAP